MTRVPLETGCMEEEWWVVRDEQEAKICWVLEHQSHPESSTCARGGEHNHRSQRHEQCFWPMPNPSTTRFTTLNARDGWRHNLHVSYSPTASLWIVSRVGALLGKGTWSHRRPCTQQESWVTRWRGSFEWESKARRERRSCSMLAHRPWTQASRARRSWTRAATRKVQRTGICDELVDDVPESLGRERVRIRQRARGDESNHAPSGQFNSSQVFLYE